MQKRPARQNGNSLETNGLLGRRAQSAPDDLKKCSPSQPVLESEKASPISNSCSLERMKDNTEVASRPGQRLRFDPYKRPKAIIGGVGGRSSHLIPQSPFAEAPEGQIGSNSTSPSSVANRSGGVACNAEGDVNVMKDQQAAVLKCLASSSAQVAVSSTERPEFCEEDAFSQSRISLRHGPAKSSHSTNTGAWSTKEQSVFRASPNDPNVNENCTGRSTEQLPSAPFSPARSADACKKSRVNTDSVEIPMPSIERIVHSGHPLSSSANPLLGSSGIGVQLASLLPVQSSRMGGDIFDSHLEPKITQSSVATPEGQENGAFLPPCERKRESMNRQSGEQREDFLHAVDAPPSRVSTGRGEANLNPLQYPAELDCAQELRRNDNFHGSFSAVLQGGSVEYSGNLSNVGGLEDSATAFQKSSGQEWLQVPSLFYLFASIIKWNELQLQRRSFETAVQENRQRHRSNSLSLMTVWSPRQEEELHDLERHISYSVFEVEGVMLNRLFVSWSKRQLRRLVQDVASTWKKKGPYSPEFETISSRLFDAISSEETCSLRNTWLFSFRKTLGDMNNRPYVTIAVVALFIISALCIVFLGVFGRHHVVACVVLSAALGVTMFAMVIMMLFLLHHNTYADAAATFFRQEAITVAKGKMEDDGDEQVGNKTYNGADIRSHNTSWDDLEDVPSNEIASRRNIGAYPLSGTTSAKNGRKAMDNGGVAGGDRGVPNESNDENKGRAFRRDHVRTDEGFLSKISPTLQAEDSRHRENLERDRENALLMSALTFEQHQMNIDHHQSLVLREQIGPQLGICAGGKENLPILQNQQRDGSADHRPFPRLPKVAASSGGENTAGMSSDSNNDGQMTSKHHKMTMEGLSSNINITALVYCKDDGVMAKTSQSLWEHNFLLFRSHSLQTLDATYRNGSERFKVFLIYAPIVPEGTSELQLTLKWLRVERRPVFFFSPDVSAFSPLMPHSSRMEVPFSKSDINMLLCAGIGVDAEVNSASSTMLGSYAAKPFKVPAYTLGRRLGGGAYGNVFEAEMVDTGAKCAVKRMYLKDEFDDENHDELPGGGGGGDERGAAGGTSSTPSAGQHGSGSAVAAAADGGPSAQLREIAQEVEIMSSLCHPNIVQYMFCERDDNCISIFMELCTGGSLSSLIHNGILVDPDQIKRILTDIISSVAYLHNKRIVHRDLKPDNVLFRDGRAKVTDFGTAVRNRGDLRLIKGTFGYMAPEILVGDPYGRACDVWSIGCIAAEVLSVGLPQHALGLPEMCEYYRGMELDSALPIECSVSAVQDFLLTCLQRNPNARQTASQLLTHAMLRPEDTSIHRWMEEVVKSRREQQQHQQMNQTYRSTTGFHNDSDFDLDSNQSASLRSSEAIDRSTFETEHTIVSETVEGKRSLVTDRGEVTLSSRFPPV